MLLVKFLNIVLFFQNVKDLMTISQGHHRLEEHNLRLEGHHQHLEDRHCHLEDHHQCLEGQQRDGVSGVILLVVCQVVVAALWMVVDLRHRRLWSSRCTVCPPDRVHKVLG